MYTKDLSKLPMLNKTIRFGYFGINGFGAVIIWFKIRFGVFLSEKKK